MQAVVEREKDARARVLRAALEGRDPPGELVREWARAREEYAKRAREQPVEEAQRALSEELGAIEQRLARLEESGRTPRQEALRSAVDLGERLRWVLWLGDILSEELSTDPLALVEEEFRGLELQGRNMGRLDARLRPGARTLLDQVDKERLGLLRGRLARFVGAQSSVRTTGHLETASYRWIAAGEAWQVESDGLREAGGRDGLRHVAGGETLDELRERRDALLASCREALERCSPEEVEEFVRSASADLLDQVTSVLSEGESSDSAARLDELDLTSRRIESFLDVLGEWRPLLARRGTLDRDGRRRFRQAMRQVSRARKQVRRAEAETRVDKRLEEAFGKPRVNTFESTILVLIFALLGLVFWEWRLPIDLPAVLVALDGGPLAPAVGTAIAAQTVRVFYFIDLVYCTIFQIDFFVRWAFAGWGLAYFLRHFFFESLPALPYGFAFHHLGVMEEARAIILVRLARLRGALRLRAIFLVAIRAFRVVVFLVRGVDRAAEKFRAMIDRDIVVFETDPLGEAPESPVRRRALALENRRHRLVRTLHDDVPWDQRAEVLRRHAVALGAETRMATQVALPYQRSVVASRDEVHIERVIHNFLDCDVTRVVGLVGRDGVERIARWLRFLDVPGFRNAPILRRLAPAGRVLNPAEAVSRAVNALGRILQEMLGMVRFWADLSGITTGPQILDRVGSAVVAASKRPAVRLILFGTLFLVVEGLAVLLGISLLENVSKTLTRFLGIPILILGSLCLVFLLTGRWFKRIAGEALDHYLRTADAQFYPLIKARKFLRFDEDIDTLYRSVLRPECRLRCTDDVPDEDWTAFLAEPVRERAQFLPGRSNPGEPRFDEFLEDRETIALLYRDFLDGPVLHRTDDKASVQLLGNVSIVNIRRQTLGLGSKELRKLERLALERGNLLSLGPYFWFRFITESLAIETAKLILEYNAVCIPKEQRPFADAKSLERFERFLAERAHESDAARARHQRSRAATLRGEEITAASFTAFDFLGPSPEGDRIVSERYGEDVLRALRQDRRAVVRDIFGTRPYHLRPRHQRVINPYRLYRKYLGGAKFLFLPFVAVGAFLRLNLAGLAQVRELVEEVLGRRRARRTALSRFAGFDVAVRKINRMRKPLFMEALRLRATVDVEYLGIRLPGQPRDPEQVTFEEHLDFIGAVDAERRPILELRDRAVQDLRRLRQFLADNGWRREGLDELLDEIDASGALRADRDEVLRAIVSAYVTDHDSLRSIVTAPEWVRRFFEEVLQVERQTLVERLGDRLRCVLAVVLPHHRRRRKLFYEYLRMAEGVQGLDPVLRRRALARLLETDSEGERKLDLALRGLRHEAGVGRGAVKEALKRAACDYKVWTRKLVTVRTVQTLTVLDVRNYRDMVWGVGEYKSDERVTV